MRSRLLCAFVLASLIAAVQITSGATPLIGGTFRISHRTDPISFNGFLDYWSGSRDLHQQVYNRLIEVNVNRELIPDLAYNWKVEDEGKTFTFYLYKNVTWHDGKPFTSADVKWHWQKLNSSDIVTYVKPMLTGFKAVETPDDYTIVFKFTSPKQPLLFAYFQSDTYIHPKHIFDGKDMKTNPANKAPVGTGPFKVVEYVQDSHVVMEANKNYFKGRPYLDRLIYRIIPDQRTRLLSFEKGDVDFCDPPAAEIVRLSKTEGVKTTYTKSTTSHRLTFNFRPEAVSKYPWLSDVGVRRAFAHAINKTALVERQWKGFAYVVETAVPEPSGWAYNPTTPVYKYDPAQAERLLDEAGYKKGSDGIRFKIPWVTYNRPYSVDGSQIIKEMLKQVGIDIEIKPVEYTTYVNLYEQGEKGLQDMPVTYNHMGGWPPEELGSWMHSRPKGGMNMGFWVNERADQLLDQAYLETDIAKRKPLYYELQEIVAREVPYVFLLAEISVRAYKAEFQNVESVWSTSWIPWNQVWWTKGTPIVTATTRTASPTTAQPPPADGTWILAPAAIIIVGILAASMYLRSKKKPK